MKTRILHTEFWKNMAKHKAPKDVRLLYNYLMTNTHINMCGTYELPNEYICLETGLTTRELEKAQAWLTEKKKAYFYDGWVKVVDADNYNNYQNSPKTQESYKKEIQEVPINVLDYFNNLNDTSIDSSIDTSSILTIKHKEEIINNKSFGVLEPFTEESPNKRTIKIFNDQAFILELKEKFPSKNVDEEVEKMKDWLASKGVTKKDYAAFARNWLRNNSYSPKEPKGMEVIRIR